MASTPQFHLGRETFNAAVASLASCGVIVSGELEDFRPLYAEMRGFVDDYVYTTLFDEYGIALDALPPRIALADGGQVGNVLALHSRPPHKSLTSLVYEIAMRQLGYWNARFVRISANAFQQKMVAGRVRGPVRSDGTRHEVPILSKEEWKRANPGTHGSMWFHPCSRENAILAAKHGIEARVHAGMPAVPLHSDFGIGLYMYNSMDTASELAIAEHVPNPTGGTDSPPLSACVLVFKRWDLRADDGCSMDVHTHPELRNKWLTFVRSFRTHHMLLWDPELLSDVSNEDQVEEWTMSFIQHSWIHGTMATHDAHSGWTPNSAVAQWMVQGEHLIRADHYLKAIVVL